MATASPQFIKEQVQERLTSALDIEDFLRIIQHLSFSVVKQFVTEQIEHEPQSTFNKIYYNESSIADVFIISHSTTCLYYNAVMQHIISFDDMYHPRTVNKEQLFSERIERNRMIKLYSSTMIDESQTEQPGSTWIVHPKQRHLNAVEIELGYKGPMSLDNAIKNREMQNGDRLLVHGGVYICNFVTPHYQS